MLQPTILQGLELRDYRIQFVDVGVPFRKLCPDLDRQCLHLFETRGVRQFPLANNSSDLSVQPIAHGLPFVRLGVRLEGVGVHRKAQDDDRPGQKRP